MAIGQSLGHYTIVRPLGRGGMGEVYVAHDPRLNRDVALKVLPATAAVDSDRLERFRREAQAVAALTHPGIVTVHSVENADGVHFITLELIEGRTLDALIPAGGMSLDLYFSVAIQLADAVAAAHGRGIVHRDLKPANVMVTADDRVKVLDFGLAKLLDPAPDDAETATAGQQLTDEGRVLGTAAYMSPEQAEGRPVDHRTDIFSLGVVLYQMATGRQPFTGDTRLSVLSAIVRDTPAPVSEVNAQLPRHLARIIRKALEKKPGKRYQLAVELKNDLEELKHEIDSGEIVLSTTGVSDPEVLRQASTAGRRPGWVTLGAAGILAAFAVVSGVMAWRSPEALPPRATPTQLTTSTDSVRPAVSPDGQSVLFSRQGGLFRLAVGDSRLLPLGVDGESPSFSPDGIRVAYVSQVAAGGFIHTMGPSGGDPTRLSEGYGYDPDWSPDGARIVFSRTRMTDDPYGYGSSTFSRSQPGLVVFEVDSGEERVLEIPSARQPSWSPNGYRIAYFGTDPAGTGDIYTVLPDGTGITSVTQDPALDVSPVWSPDGRWLYFCSTRTGQLGIWRVRIDERTGDVLGAPQPVETGGLGEPGFLSVSDDGRRLVYQQTLIQSSIRVADVDPVTLQVNGAVEQLLREARRLDQLAVSTNGSALAYIEVGVPRSLFVRPAAADEEERRITDGTESAYSPRFSPDSRRVAYASNASGQREIWVANSDGSQKRRLTNVGAGDGDRQEFAAIPVWSPDGSEVAYSTYYRTGTASGVDGVYRVTPNLPWDQQAPTRLPPIREEGRVDRWSAATDWNQDGRISTQLGVFDVGTEEYLLLRLPGCDPYRLRWLDQRRLHCGSGFIDIETGRRGGLDIPSGPVGAGVQQVVLSSDRQRMFLLEQSSQSDIWMLELEELSSSMPLGWVVASGVFLILSLVIGAAPLVRRR